MASYVDTSAVLKLLVREAESADLRAWWGTADPWSSELLVTEAHRAGRRLGVDESDVDAVLDEVTLIAPSSATFAIAGGLPPVSARSLDALHVAAALELEHDLAELVTYDTRQAIAADLAGIVVSSPGRPSRWWA